MNMNNYTIKSQEAVQSAVQLAQEKGQQAIETGHLLRGVIEKGENITNFIFNKLGVNSRNVLAALDRIVDTRKCREVLPICPMRPIKCWRKPRSWRERWVTSMFLWNIFYWDYYQ